MDRAKLRGKRLDRECYRANTENYKGNTYCLGLYAKFSDSEIGDIDEKCLNCKAYTGNADNNSWLLLAGAILCQQKREEEIEAEEDE